MQHEHRNRYADVASGSLLLEPVSPCPWKMNPQTLALRQQLRVIANLEDGWIDERGLQASRATIRQTQSIIEAILNLFTTYPHHLSEEPIILLAPRDDGSLIVEFDSIDIEFDVEHDGSVTVYDLSDAADEQPDHQDESFHANDDASSMMTWVREALL
jgi:hypothetical protein